MFRCAISAFAAAVGLLSAASPVVEVSTPQELRTAIANSKYGKSFDDCYEIVLKPGVYDLSQLVPLVLPGNDGATYFVTSNHYFRIKGGAGDPAKTILDGASKEGPRAFTVHAGIIGFENLTFRNFRSTGCGGAIAWSEKGNWAQAISVSNCVFENCRAGSNGGALWRVGNATDCRFRKCRAGDCGGAAFFWGRGERLRLQRCAFDGNVAGRSGGGAYGNMTVSNCVFTANLAQKGEGGAIGGERAPQLGKISIVGSTFKDNRGASSRYHTMDRQIIGGADASNRVIGGSSDAVSGNIDGGPYVNDVSISPGDNILEARDRLRACRNPKEPVTITLRDGVYQIREPIKLTRADQGLLVRAEHPGRVFFRGSWDFAGADAAVVRDSNALKRFPASAKGHLRSVKVPHDVALQFGRADVWDLYATRSWVWTCDDNTNGVVPCRAFAIDGRLMQVARWPNRVKLGHKGQVRLAGSNVVDSLTFKMLDPRMRNWDFTGNDIIIAGYFASVYDADGYRIESMDKKTGVLKLAERKRAELHPGAAWFENVPEELDAPGEWWFDRAAETLYFWPPEGFSEKSVCSLPFYRGKFFDLDDAKNVSFEGLVFESKVMKPAVFGDNVENVKFAGCKFRAIESGRIGVLSGDGIVFQSCDFTSFGGGALAVRGGDEKTLRRSENLVENCHFAFGGLTRPAGDCLVMTGVGNTQRHNLIEEMPYFGGGYYGPDNLIEYCRYRHVAAQVGDASAIYTSGAGRTFGSTIRYNDVMASRGYVNGIYLDDLSYGNRVYGNVVRYAETCGIFLGGGRFNVISNNVITSCGPGLFIDSRGCSWPNWQEPMEKGTFDLQWAQVDYKNPPWSVKYPDLARLMDDGLDACAPLDNKFVMNVIVEIPTNRSASALGGVLGKRVPTNRVVVADNVYVRVRGAGKGTGWPREGGFITLDGTADKPLDLGFVDLPGFRWSDEEYSYFYDLGNFNLKKGSLLQKTIPGFVPIPWDKIGLYRDKWRTEVAK